MTAAADTHLDESPASGEAAGSVWVCTCTGIFALDNYEDFVRGTRTIALLSAVLAIPTFAALMFWMS
jgi:Ni/Fe-hydrogenase subunit HybB-like protein